MSGLGLPDHLAAALRSSDHRFIVTGASGWIGSATLHMLKGALGPDSFRHRVYAFAGSKRTLRLADGTEVPLLQLEALDELRAGPWLLFHYAFLGKERVAEMPLANYVAANTRITEIVRRAVARLQPAGMFLASSGAVYRPDRSIETDIATNPYGVLKHRDEAIFADACAAAGTKLVTARVFNLSGEYINKLSSYALSSFILDALVGRPIEIRANRRVFRSYLYVGDLVKVSIANMLAEATEAVSFDASGNRVVELEELAGVVSKAVGLSERVIRRPVVDQSLKDNFYAGCATSLLALADAQRLILCPLERQVELTRGYILAGRYKSPFRRATAT